MAVDNKKTIVSSHNDWDPLEECFVGTATHARFPTMDRSTHSFCFTTEKYKDIKDLEGPVDQKIIDESNEDLDKLADTLKGLGVKVRVLCLKIILRPLVHQNGTPLDIRPTPVGIYYYR